MLKDLYRKIFRIKREHLIMLLAVSFGLLMWIADAVIDYFWFYKGEGSLLQLLITDVPAHEIYMRTVILTFFLVFGLIMSRLFAKRRLAEEALLESEENLAITLNSIGDAIIAADKNGKVTRMNPVAERLTGWLFSEAKGCPLEEVFHIVNSETRRVLEDPVGKVLRLGRIIGLANHTILIAREGTERQIADSASPILNGKGAVVGVVLVFRDVTDEYRMQRRLQESEKRFRYLFENMLEGFAYCKMLFDKNNNPVDFVYLRVNDSFEKLTGLKGKDVIDKKVTEVIPGIKDSDPELFDIYGKVALTGEATEFEIYFAPLDIWLSISVYCPEKGYFVAVFDNITDRKRAEQKAIDLQSLLMSIRNINQLIVQETDIKLLMQRTCDILLETRIYTGAGIALLNEDMGKIVRVGHSGDHQRKQWEISPDGKGRAPKCIKSLIKSKSAKIIRSNPEYCGKCSYCIRGSEHQSILIPMMKEESVVGILSICLERECEINEDEKKLLDEIVGDLVFAITKMKAEEELRLHSEIMTNMSEGVYLIRAEDNVIVYTNPKFEEMFGYGPDEMTGKHVSIVNAPTDKSPEEKAREVLEILDRTGEWHGEIHTIRKDSTPFWCYANVSVFNHPEYGRVLVAVYSDITDRKRAEEQIKKDLKEKEVLLKEIHHRVKNNLQVISSLLSLQSNYANDERTSQMFKESQDRVRTMALVHESLYRSADLANIDFAEYIRDLVNDLYDSYDVGPSKIVATTKVKDISLTVDMAVPCGLIINELVSNALKYAFPSSWEGKGEIEVIIGETGKNEIELIVKDNGVGIPEDIDIRKTESLGMHLVVLLVESQLKGTVELNREKGTEFIIRFNV